MKIFITGATGFIGKNFMKLALKNNYFVYATTRKKGKQKFYKEKKLKWLYGDFDNNWKNELSKSDILVHIAAEGISNNFSKNIYDVNVFKSLNLLKHAIKAGCRKWLIISTSSEYGEELYGKKNFSLSTNRIPENDYGLSKAIFSDQSKLLAKKFNCKLRKLIIFPTYGYGENSRRLFPSILRAIKNNKNYKLNNPFEKRDFSNIDFVCKNLIDALNFKKNKFKDYQAWHISQNDPKTVKDFTEIIWKKKNAVGKLIFKKRSERFLSHISDFKSLWKV